MTREDIINKAKEINLVLKLSDEYLAYQKAAKKVEEHAAAGIMLNDFRKKQMEIQRKALEGEDVEASLGELRKLWDVVSMNPYVRDVIEAELAFGQLYSEVMQEVVRDIDLLASDKPQDN